MKILVLGASRGVGRHVIEQAVRRGHAVTALARNVQDVPGSDTLKVIEADATDPSNLGPHLLGQDVVLCTVGAGSRGSTQLYSNIARNLASEMPRAGVYRLIFLSNFGVMNEVGGVSGFLVNFFLRHVIADHRRALEIMQNSTVNWTAVRPMRLTNGPLTQIYRVTAEGLPLGGSRISRADVANFMLKQAVSDEFFRAVPGIAY